MNLLEERGPSGGSPTGRIDFVTDRTADGRPMTIRNTRRPRRMGADETVSTLERIVEHHGRVCTRRSYDDIVDTVWRAPHCRERTRGQPVRIGS
jgi:hypothetical protein